MFFSPGLRRIKKSATIGLKVGCLFCLQEKASDLLNCIVAVWRGDHDGSGIFEERSS